jgi:predicted chitinase
MNDYDKVWGENAPDAVNFPELLEEPKYAVRSGVFFWLHHRLYEISDEGSDPSTVDKITRVINQHTASYRQRREHFASAWNNHAFQNI